MGGALPLEYDLSQLVVQSESETLDFKRQFHENTVELLHDILCLANAYAEGTRYLVFGVANDRTICGVDEDLNRRKNAEIQDMLRASNLNRVPDVVLNEHDLKGKTIAVLTIRNRPDKPFFALKDKQEGKLRLRNGVVYTRLGDTNIPLTETAPEDRIELMWRERFGIGLPPLERFRRLLADAGQWRAGSNGDKTVLHHEAFPEFTIMDGEDLSDPFEEDWAMKFPNPHARSFNVEVRYFGTTLRNLLFVHCDGYRYRLPAPERTSDGHWVLDRTSLAYGVALLFRQYDLLDETFRRIGVKLVD
ncbi:MAG TPA: ATP-binding protein [Myxococcaceae bacterium]|nr:ATP-binding protein [Myxococcaceae bacterium]